MFSCKTFYISYKKCRKTQHCGKETATLGICHSCLTHNPNGRPKNRSVQSRKKSVHHLSHWPLWRVLAPPFISLLSEEDDKWRGQLLAELRYSDHPSQSPAFLRQRQWEQTLLVSGGYKYHLLPDCQSYKRRQETVTPDHDRQRPDNHQPMKSQQRVAVKKRDSVYNPGRRQVCHQPVGRRQGGFLHLLI